MRRLVIALALTAAPALAQQVPPGQTAWQIMYQREVAAHHDDLGAAVQLEADKAALQARVDALTKERDALKEAAKPGPTVDLTPPGAKPN